jgi:hypothetical protein
MSHVPERPQRQQHCRELNQRYGVRFILRSQSRRPDLFLSIDRDPGLMLKQLFAIPPLLELLVPVKGNRYYLLQIYRYGIANAVSTRPLNIVVATESDKLVVAVSI